MTTDTTTTVRALPRTEPATHCGPVHPIGVNSLMAPAQEQIHAAFAELAKHHVDALTAREWLTDMVASIGAERDAQENAELRNAPIERTAQVIDDPTLPTREEWAQAGRLLNVALAVVNGKRKKLCEVGDHHISTARGRIGVNTYTDLVSRSRLTNPVRPCKIQIQAIREARRTTLHVPTVIEWDQRVRALSLTIVRTGHDKYRIAGFAIL